MKPHATAIVTAGLLLVGCPDAPPVATDPPGSGGGAANSDEVMAQASAYIEERSQQWLDDRDCALSCHTTLPYLMTNSFTTPESRALADRIRERIAPRVTAWPEVAHFYPIQPKATEAVINAVALLYYDMKLKQALSPLSCQAAAAMWASQEADGSFAWWSFNLQPFELGESNVWAGAMVSLTIAKVQPLLTDPPCTALAADSPELKQLHAWLDAQRDVTDTHAKSWLLWADQAWDETRLSPDSRRALFAELRAKQRPDGGFGLRDYLPGADANQSDAYMSSLMGMLLRRSDDDANAQALLELESWMSAHHSLDKLKLAASPNKPGVAHNDALFTDTAVSYWMLYTALEAPQP